MFREESPNVYVEADASMVPPDMHAGNCRPGITAINATGFEWKDASDGPSVRFIRQ